LKDGRGISRMGVDSYYSGDLVTLYHGRALDVLRALPGGSVQCIVTSPPYLGLRDYGLPSIEYPMVRYAPMPGLPMVEVAGCDPACAHEWVSKKRMLHTGNSASAKERSNGGAFHGDQATNDHYCRHCHGWRGSLGLEPTIEMYIGHLVLVFREVRRVLRDDGVCWLNIGDSYASGTGPRTNNNGQEGSTMGWPGQRQETLNKAAKMSLPPTNTGLKPKQLLGIPWRLAFALQADGWWLRSDVIWAKGISFCASYSGSTMPEPVRDRPTKAHEYLFLLAKSKQYFYDAGAVKEQSQGHVGLAASFARTTKDHTIPNQGVAQHRLEREPTQDNGTRNLRSVWVLNPARYPGSHFATFPPRLVEPCIRAGTSAHGCCPQCGAAWKRVTGEGEKQRIPRYPSDDKLRKTKMKGPASWNATKTLGWRPSCKCSGLVIIDDPPRRPTQKKKEDLVAYDARLASWKVRADAWQRRWADLKPLYAAEPVDPCTVLDPFGGTGTVAEVAIRLKRQAVLIEISEAYCKQAIDRFGRPIQISML